LPWQRASVGGNAIGSIPWPSPENPPVCCIRERKEKGEGKKEKEKEREEEGKGKGEGEGEGKEKWERGRKMRPFDTVTEIWRLKVCCHGNGGR